MNFLFYTSGKIASQSLNCPSCPSVPTSRIRSQAHFWLIAIADKLDEILVTLGVFFPRSVFDIQNC